MALTGAWNSHLDMARCDAAGDPLPGAAATRLWQARMRARFCSPALFRRIPLLAVLRACMGKRNRCILLGSPGASTPDMF